MTDHSFRNYETPTRQTVEAIYRLNHENQTLAFARDRKATYTPGKLGRMAVWDACELLNSVIDDSDPDTGLSQIEHLVQTAEAIRRDGHPRWFQLTGLIHDLGKILCLHGEPQWAVVGDTFPLGCAFSREVVYAEFFEANPDSDVAAYQTECGIYERHCGLDAVTMSWGHDEYLYAVVRDYLPEEAQYIVRYHSFYAAHSAGAYSHLMNDRDIEMFEWVKLFQPYDLYSKGDAPPDVEAVAPYYRKLIDEYFPAEIAW
jgi:inositol oxygenase